MSDSFDPFAAAYRRARPPYPPALYDELMKRGGVPVQGVLELGAGSGQFTQGLSERGIPVRALDPSRGMLERAPKLDFVQWGEGRFEATGRPDASERWVIIAQAFHWAELPQALNELARVLEPGGRLSMFWNLREARACPALRLAHDVVEHFQPGFDEGYRATAWDERVGQHPSFSFDGEARIEHRVSMERERFIDLWRSHNKLSQALGPESRRAFLEELATRLDAADFEWPQSIHYTVRLFEFQRTMEV